MENIGSQSAVKQKQLSNGDIFVGTVKGSGKVTGFGVLKEPSNNTFFGEFLDGKFHGKGSLTSPDGILYVGEFQENEKNGLGKLKEPHKNQIYVGNFCKDQKRGKGQLRDLQNQSVRIGTFTNDDLQGIGIFAHKDTLYKYIGNFKKGEMDGLGRESKDGLVYTGGFLRGERNGLGFLKDNDQTSILVSWSNGVREGFGSESLQNRDVYDGDFKENLKNGLGIYVHSDDNMTYTGAFENSMRSGFGRLESESFIYVGAWQNDQRNGLGYQTNKEGGSYFGYWKDDLRVGLGIEIGGAYEYKGEWEDDQPNGRAIVKIKNKGVKGAIFSNGNLQSYTDIEALEDLAKQLDKLNFEKYFSKAKEKLSEIEDYIEDRKQALKKKFQSMNQDFKDLEEQTKNKQKEIDIWVENIETSLNLKLNQLRKLCQEQGIDLDEFIAKKHKHISLEGKNSKKGDPSKSGVVTSRSKSKERSEFSNSQPGYYTSRTHRGKREGTKSPEDRRSIRKQSVDKLGSNRTGSKDTLQSAHAKKMQPSSALDFNLLRDPYRESDSRYQSELSKKIQSQLTNTRNRDEFSKFNSNVPKMEAFSTTQGLQDPIEFLDEFYGNNSAPNRPISVTDPSLNDPNINRNIEADSGPVLTKINEENTTNLERANLELERENYHRLKNQFEHDRSKVEREKAELDSLARRLEEEIDKMNQNKNHTEDEDARKARELEDQEVESEKQKLIDEIKKIEEEFQLILKEKEQYEKVRKEADAESGELKRAKIDTDRKRIYYHNYEGTLEKKRADLQHEQRLYQKERTIFDNKKKFLENETVDMEKYKIDLEKREQQLKDDIEHFKNMEPTFQHKFEEKKRLDKELQDVKSALMDTERELRRARLKAQESNAEVDHVENQIRMYKEQKEAEIRTLQNEEDELQAKIEKQRTGVENMRNQSSELQIDIQRLKDEIALQKKSNLEKLDKQISTEQELIQQNRELQELGIQIVDQTNDHQDLEDAIHRKKEHIRKNKQVELDLQDEIEKINEEIRKKNMQLSDLENIEVQSVQDDINFLETEIAQQKQAIAQLEVDVQQQETERQKYIRERSEHEARVKDLKTQQEKFEAELKTLKTQKNSTDVDFKLKEEEHAILKEDEVLTAQEISKVEKQIAELEAKLKLESNNENKIDLMKAELDRRQKELDSNNANLDELKKDLESKQLECKSQHDKISEIDEENKKLQELIIKIQEEQAAAEKSKSEFESQLKNLEQQGSNDQIKNQNEQEEQQKQKEKELAKMLEAATQAETDLKTKNAELQDELNRILEEQKLLKTEEQALEQEIDSIIGDTDDYDINEWRILENQFKQELEAFEKLQQETQANKDEELKSTQEQLERKEAELKEKVGELESLTKAAQELEESNMQKQREFEEEQKKAIQDRENSMKLEREAKEKAEAELQAKQAELELQNRQLEAITNKNEDELWQQEKKDLIEEIERLRKLIEEEESRMKQYQAEMDELKKKRELEEKRVNEEAKKDVTADDSFKQVSEVNPLFFKSSKPPVRHLKLSRSYKMDISPDGKTMYVAGESCLYLVSLFPTPTISQKLKHVKACEVKVLKNGFIMLHNLNNNSLEIYNQALTKVKEHKGQTPSKSNDDPTRSARFTGDGKCQLWMRGKNNLSVVSQDCNIVRDIDDFWMQVQKKRKLEVICCAVASRNGEKIFGFGKDIEGSYILIYHEINCDRVNVSASQYKTQIDSWSCAEISYDDSTIFIGGCYGTFASILALEFNSSLKTKKFEKLTMGSFANISRLKRLEGSDILLAAVQNEILVIMFKNNEFNHIHRFQNINMQDSINSMVFHSSYLYFLEVEGTNIGVIEMEKRINQTELSNREFSKCEEANKKVDIEKIIQHNPDLLESNVELPKEDTSIKSMFDFPGTLKQRIEKADVKAESLPQSSYHRVSASAQIGRCALGHSKGVDLFDINGGKFTFLTQISNVNPHSINNVGNYIAIQGFDTNNFEIYSEDTKRGGLNGQPSKHKARNLLNVKTAHKNKSLIWLSAEDSISIVKVKNISHNIVPDFFVEKSISQDCGTPIALARMVDPDIILGLVCFNSSEYLLKCVYVSEKFSEWLPIMKFIPEDTSVSQSVLFVLSSWKTKPHLVLTACKIANGSLSIISHHELKSLTAIKSGCAKVYQREDLGLDFVAIVSGGALSLVQFEKTSFTLIKDFTGLHKGVISDISIAGNRIFTCAEGENTVTIISVPVDETETQKIVQKIEKQKKEIKEKKKQADFCKDPQIVKIKVAGKKDISKLDFGKSSSKIYFVCDAIYSRSTSAKNQDTPSKLIQCLNPIWFKILEKHVLIQESGKFNLLIYDLETLKLIKTFDGAGKFFPDNYPIQSCRYVNDDNYLIWMDGGANITLINAKDPIGNHNEIKGFYGSSKNTPLCAIASKDGKKAIGLGISGDDGKIILCLWSSSSSKKLTQVDCNSKFKDLECRMCLEASKGDEYAFMGGSTMEEYQEGEAIMIALTFDQNMSQVCSLKFDQDENRFVSKMRRVSGRNTIAVATYQNIYIVKFDKSAKKLEVVNSVKQVHSSNEPIKAMMIKDNCVYTSADGDDNIVQLEYPYQLGQAHY